jgi:hypothetical protein
MTTRAAVRTVPPQVAEIFSGTKRLTTVERLALAKLLLESVLASELGDEADWSAMSLDTFQRDWDNPEDAIYDNWRELYGVPTR